MSKFGLLTLTAIIIGNAPSLQAHHSVTAHYDMSKSIEIRGTVVDFKLRSPHASMVVEGIAYVDGVAQQTSAERWEIESSAAPGLRAMGIAADTFKAGDSITVIAAPNRQPGFRLVNSSTFITASGQRYSRASATAEILLTEAPTGNITAMTGRWQARGAFATSVSPLPLNAAGEAARDQYQPKGSPANTCEPMNVPDLFNAPYLFEISASNNEISIHNQPWEVVRTVALDGVAVVSQPDGLFGTISGSIDGNTVVLKSSGFPASRWGLGSATQLLGSGQDIPSSEQKTLEERFTLSEDGLTLAYEYTLTDPVYLLSPYQGKLEFPRIAADSPMYAYDCEIESASMFSRTAEDQP